MPEGEVFRPECDQTYLPPYVPSVADEEDEKFNRLKSVSMQDIYSKFVDEHSEALRSHMTPNSRSKLFNSSFKIWKKRDSAPSPHNIKVGQIFDVNVSHVSESSIFYAQQASRRADLNYLESCLQNHADILIKDKSLHGDLFSFQELTAKFDMVLVKTNENRWRRAVFLEQVASSSFDAYSDNDDSSSNVSPRSSLGQKRRSEFKVFFSFYLIDWGNEEVLVKKQSSLDTEIFILPTNEKLIQIGPFALKCSINQSMVNLPETIASNSPQNEMNRTRRNLFEEKFKALISNKRLRLRVTQKVFLKNELELMVELYFMPEDAEGLIGTFEGTYGGEVESLGVSLAPMDRTRLGCVPFILNEIILIEKRNIEKVSPLFSSA
jgi:hypothetical protein